MPEISTGWPASMGVVLTAFHVSPSMNTLPPAASIRESALTDFPGIASRPVLAGFNCARMPLPTTKMKNSAVSSVAGNIQRSLRHRRCFGAGGSLYHGDAAAGADLRQTIGTIVVCTS